MKKTGNRTRKINPVEGLEHGFIRSKQKALEIATQYVREATGPGVPKPSGPSEGLYKFPTQGAPFEISEKALQNTLKYIYDTLKHPCYMLCISPQKRHFYKLEQSETAPIFEQLTKQEFQRVQNTLSPTDKSHIEKVLQQPFRIMQCIVKPQSKESFSREYLEWIGEMADSLPSGVFLLNLTDAVLLRKDGKMPFPKTIEPPTPILTPMLPIFSTSGKEEYWDIPIPTYDDIEQHGSIKWNTDWDSKKEVAVFRGGPTGCGTRADTNARLAVAKLNSPLLDAGVVSGESRSIRFDPKHGLSMLSMEGINTVERLTMEEQSNYKYIVHIDGNVLAYRLLTTMLSGSVLLRIKSPYVSWIDHYLIPNQHYIEVSEPKDLLKKIQWCKENDDICQRIALRSRELAQRVLSPRFQTGYFTGLLWNTVSPKIAETDCLPWDRSPSRFLSLKQPKPFRPNQALRLCTNKSPTSSAFIGDKGNSSHALEKCEGVKPIGKKAKKTTRKKISSSMQQVIVEPPPVPSPEKPRVSRMNEPEPEGPESYMKATEKEKCRKGFSTDRKNKMRCVAQKEKQVQTKPVAIEPEPEPETEEPAVEERQQGVVSPPISEIPLPSPGVPTIQQGAFEPYMKANEKEKCRKGFLTDRKNKMRCVPK